MRGVRSTTSCSASGCAWSCFCFRLPGAPIAPGDGSEFRILIRYDLALFFFLGVAVACWNIRVADVPPVFDRLVPWFVVGLLLGLLMLLSAASVLLDATYGASSVLSSAMGLVKRFVGAFLMIAAVAKLSTRGWLVDVPRHFTFRLFCSHAVVFRFLAAVAVAFEVKIGRQRGEGGVAPGAFSRNCHALRLGFPSGAAPSRRCPQPRAGAAVHPGIAVGVPPGCPRRVAGLLRSSAIGKGRRWASGS